MAPEVFMDNPDYRYWITDIGDGTGYRITGNIGSSVYQSITAYAGRGIADASTVMRIDSDDLTVSGAPTQHPRDAPLRAPRLRTRPG
ncbi:MAG: hypothetical protein ACXWZ2_14935 [Mycobacterium sp.]